MSHTDCNTPADATNLEIDCRRLLLKEPRRAQQACDTCRLRKQRCDGKDPCKTCTDQGGRCIYAPVQPSKSFMKLELIYARVQELCEESRNAATLLQQISEQSRKSEKRIQNLEAMIPGHHQSSQSRVNADPGLSTGLRLSTLAYDLYDKQSPLIGFVLILETMEKHFKISLKDYSEETKECWLKLTYNESRLLHHDPSCVVHEPQDIPQIRDNFHVISKEIFDLIYQMPGYSALSLRRLEEIVKLARTHINTLQQWLHCLPPVLSWKDEDIHSLKFHVRLICSDYVKQRSMSLLPYLYVAKDLKNFLPAGEIAEPGYSPGDLIKIASECIDSAFQCAELSSRNYPSLKEEVTCKGCHDSVDYATHERFEMILILVAVYQSELGPYLPGTGKKLSMLVAQTIDQALASKSNLALQMDAEILQAIWSSFRLDAGHGAHSRKTLREV